MRPVRGNPRYELRSVSWYAHGSSPEPSTCAGGRRTFGPTADATVSVTTALPAGWVATVDAYSTPYGTDLTVAAPGVLRHDDGSGPSVTSTGTRATGGAPGTWVIVGTERGR